MRIINPVFGLLYLFVFIVSLHAQEGIYDKVKTQLIKKDNIFAGRYPEYTKNGIYQYRDKVNWFSGFIGGELWNLYDITKDEELKRRAITHADALLPYTGIDYTHDMGFIFFPSLVKTYEHTGIKKYRDAAIQAALTLAKRFNEKGNYIRAWGKLGSPKKAGLMIIDTMINLELLFRLR